MRMRQLCKIRLPVPKDYVGVGHQHHSVYGRRFLWPILGIYLDIAWRDSRKITKTLRYSVYRPIFKSGTYRTPVRSRRNVEKRKNETLFVCYVLTVLETAQQRGPVRMFLNFCTKQLAFVVLAYPFSHMEKEKQRQLFISFRLQRNKTSLSYYSNTGTCLFLELPPSMGQGLLIHEVSRAHTTTHHSMQDSSG